MANLLLGGTKSFDIVIPSITANAIGNMLMKERIYVIERFWADIFSGRFGLSWQLLEKYGLNAKIKVQSDCSIQPKITASIELIEDRKQMVA